MTTPNIDLPEIVESQALKYLTHNTALWQIDALLPAVVQDKGLIEPPRHNAGWLYIVPADATAEWTRQDNSLVYSQNRAWVFVTPQKDWRVYVADEQVNIVLMGSSGYGMLLSSLRIS